MIDAAKQVNDVDDDVVNNTLHKKKQNESDYAEGLIMHC